MTCEIWDRRREIWRRLLRTFLPGFDRRGLQLLRLRQICSSGLARARKSSLDFGETGHPIAQPLRKAEWCLGQSLHVSVWRELGCRFCLLVTGTDVRRSAQASERMVCKRRSLSPTSCGVREICNTLTLCRPSLHCQRLQLQQKDGFAFAPGFS